MATRRLMRFVFAIVTTAVITSCNIVGKQNPNGAKGVAESFSREYFNLRYKNAAKYGSVVKPSCNPLPSCT